MSSDTVSGLLSEGRRRFTVVGIETAAIDARLLLQEATGLTSEEMIASPGLPVSSQALATFEHFAHRREAYEPVSRILGWREFYGRRFMITPDVLDPRPDTESVIALALAMMPNGRFVDLGTGSGAIAITLAAESPGLSGFASDISAEALDVARQNAASHGVSAKLCFHQGDWLIGIDERFDLIVSNPPYIEKSASLMPDVAGYDPPLALFGGADGLNAYRQIGASAKRNCGNNGVLILEIGQGRAGPVALIMESQGFALASQRADLSGTTRALAFKLA